MEKERKKIVLPEGVRFEDTVFGKLEKRKQEILTQINMTTPEGNNSLTEKLVQAVMEHNECARTAEYVYIHKEKLTEAIRSVLGQEGDEDEKLQAIFYKYIWEAGNINMDDFLSAIKELYQSHQFRDKWISVEERLPEKDTDVLLLLADGKTISIGSYNYSWSEYVYSSPSRVTHWQPLPPTT